MVSVLEMCPPLPHSGVSGLNGSDLGWEQTFPSPGPGSRTGSADSPMSLEMKLLGQDSGTQHAGFPSTAGVPGPKGKTAGRDGGQGREKAAPSSHRDGWAPVAAWVLLGTLIHFPLSSGSHVRFSLPWAVPRDPCFLRIC